MCPSPTLAALSGAPDPRDNDPGWWRRRLADPRLKPALRTCLGPLCWGRKRFMSEHAGQRICPSCRAVLRETYGIGLDEPDDAAGA